MFKKLISALTPESIRMARATAHARRVLADVLAQHPDLAHKAGVNR